MGGELKHSDESGEFVVVELDVDDFHYKVQFDFALKLSIVVDEVEELVDEPSLGEGEGDDVDQVEQSKVEEALADGFDTLLVRLLHQVYYSNN